MRNPTLDAEARARFAKQLGLRPSDPRVSALAARGGWSSPFAAAPAPRARQARRAAPRARHARSEGIPGWVWLAVLGFLWWNAQPPAQ
jgi:hypothetical protein